MSALLYISIYIYVILLLIKNKKISLQEIICHYKTPYIKKEERTSHPVKAYEVDHEGIKFKYNA